VRKAIAVLFCLFGLCPVARADSITDAENTFEMAGQAYFYAWQAYVNGSGSLQAFDSAADAFLITEQSLIDAYTQSGGSDSFFAIATASFYAVEAFLQAEIDYDANPTASTYSSYKSTWNSVVRYFQVLNALPVTVPDPVTPPGPAPL
jgi:hypothetical protein